MIELNIPGFCHPKLQFEHAVFDFNGTLAITGEVIAGLAPLLNELSQKLQIHVVTGDTFGSAKQELANIHCTLQLIGAEHQTEAKLAYVEQLGAEKCIAIGNGRNDRLMLKAAGVGIIVLGDEGTAAESLMAADLLLPSIFKVFDLLQDTRHLSATLRG